MEALNKQKIVTAIVAQLAEGLAAIIKSATAAHGGAVHEDAVAKSKYDTHGLELSYLAGAQFERANVLRALMTQYQEWQLKDFSAEDPIDLSAFIVLKGRDESQFFFLGISGVSLNVLVDGIAIRVITPQSPLGEHLLGLYEGDELELNLGQKKNVTIVAVR